MRTTLDVADDVLAAARTLAAERGTSIGVALSDLARKGLQPAPLGDEDGLPVFTVEPGAPVITPEMVSRAQDDA